MKFSTAYNKRESLRRAIHDCFHMTKLTRCSHVEHLARMDAKVWSRVRTEKVPGWVQSYLSGVADTLADANWQNLEFVYLYEGELYSTHRDSTFKTTEIFYQTDRGHILGDCPCAHVWKGTDKAWNAFEIPNNRAKVADT